VILVILVLMGMTAAGGLYLKLGRARSIRRLERDVEDDIRRRLESVAAEVGGRVAEGPSLRSADGVMMLIASRAPQSLVVDLVKFTGPVATPHLLTLLPMRDAAKAIAHRNLKPVTPVDPSIAATWKVLSSDDGFARAAVTRELIRHLEELNRFARVRARVQVAGEAMTITALRGLSTPEELKAFHDGSVAVLGCLRSSLSGRPA
jgi:hypothetical protein